MGFIVATILICAREGYYVIHRRSRLGKIWLGEQEVRGAKDRSRNERGTNPARQTQRGTDQEIYLIYQLLRMMIEDE